MSIEHDSSSRLHSSGVQCRVLLDRFISVAVSVIPKQSIDRCVLQLALEIVYIHEVLFQCSRTLRTRYAV